MKTKHYVLGGSILAAAGVIALIQAMKTIPKGAVAVKPFDVKKYMGKWHEIARLDYLFERNVTDPIAEYSLNEDGSVKVVNSGYNYKKGEHEEVTGRAVFAGDPDEAMLKVSFFGPFYSGYNVIAIDPDYKHALVVGKNHHYMWLLSREKHMPGPVKKEYLQKAMELGYDISKLVWSEEPNPEDGDYCVYTK